MQMCSTLGDSKMESQKQQTPKCYASLFNWAYTMQGCKQIKDDVLNASPEILLHILPQLLQAPTQRNHHSFP
ncbi:hypothetical protein Sjap_003829 [Stephania japonica]|uniref:Uncharacterized protein n=1 Tax=Stephania japonica TaxID=461633 RepID=A0AAP0KR99_9MAGN